MRKVDNLACVQGQDARALIPEPMLMVGTFQSVEPAIFDSKGVTIFEESFVGGHHILTVGQSGAGGEPVARSEVESGAGEKRDCILAKCLIGAAAENGWPSLVPAGTQANPLSLAGVGVIDDIDVFADAQFVLSVFAQPVQACFRIRILRVEQKSLLILRARFRRTTQQCQHASAARENLWVRGRELSRLIQGL